MRHCFRFYYDNAHDIGWIVLLNQFFSETWNFESKSCQSCDAIISNIFTKQRHGISMYSKQLIE